MQHDHLYQVCGKMKNNEIVGNNNCEKQRLTGNKYINKSKTNLIIMKYSIAFFSKSI